MTLAPYLLALAFGLLISALLHFVLVWPAREPAEDVGDAAGARDDAAGDTPAQAPAAARGKASAPRRRTSRRRR